MSSIFLQCVIFFLTNQQNQVINLNGLTFDISLKLEFIATKDLPLAPNHRADFEKGQAEFIKQQSQFLKNNDTNNIIKEKKTKKKNKE